MPTITVTGACSILATLAGDTQASSRVLASAERTNWNRAGQLLAAVGPNFSKS